MNCISKIICIMAALGSFSSVFSMGGKPTLIGGGSLPGVKTGFSAVPRAMYGVPTNPQQPVPQGELPSVKACLNAVLAVPGDFLRSPMGQAIVAKTIEGAKEAVKFHMKYLHPNRLFETKADILAFAIAWYVLLCEIQYIRETYQHLTKSNPHDKRGWFEYLFSWKKHHPTPSARR